MKIGVILGSTRRVRRGERVAKWLMGQLAKVQDAQFELLDLRDYPYHFLRKIILLIVWKMDIQILLRQNGLQK